MVNYHSHVLPVIPDLMLFCDFHAGSRSHYMLWLACLCMIRFSNSGSVIHVDSLVDLLSILIDI